MRIVTLKSKEERDKEIVKLAETGLTYDEIGEKFGLTRSMISHIAISNGVIRRPMDINPEKWRQSGISNN